MNLSKQNIQKSCNKKFRVIDHTANPEIGLFTGKRCF